MKTEQLVFLLKEKGLTVSTAESCTGGGIGHAITAVSGSSSVYAGGVISYTNEVKAKVLGVPQECLEQYGAVSSQTAKAMAEGVRTLLCTDFGVSVTGLAGPNGDGSGKPVGLVYIGAACKNGTEVREFIFSGDRDAVRRQAVDAAIELLYEITKNAEP